VSSSTTLGSLAMTEAIVSSRSHQILQSDLKVVISRDVLQWLLDHANAANEIPMEESGDYGTGVQLATSLHLLATWYSTASFDALVAGDTRPQQVVQQLEKIVKMLSGPQAIQAFVGCFKVNRSPFALTSFTAAQHGRIRFLTSVTKLVPGLRKHISGFIIAVSEGVAATVLDSSRLATDELRQRLSLQGRALGSAVAALVELFPLFGTQPSDEQVRTSLRLSYAIAVIEIIRLTQHAVDALHEVVLPVVIPPRNSDSEGDKSRLNMIEVAARSIYANAAVQLTSVSDLTAARLPWYLAPGFVEAREPHSSESVQLHPAWPSWLEWLISQVQLHRLPQNSEMEDVHLVCVTALHLLRWRNPTSNATYDTLIAVGVKKMFSDHRSQIRPSDLMPYLDLMKEACDMEGNAASTGFFTLILALLHTRFHADVKISVLSAWVGNHSLLRQTLELTEGIALSQDLSDALRGIRWVDFIGTWSGTDAARLLDVLAESLAFASECDASPLLRLASAVIDVVRSTRSTFEVNLVDDVIATNLGNANFPLTIDSSALSLFTLLTGAP
jgi:hypothetical protein